MYENNFVILLLTKSAVFVKKTLIGLKIYLKRLLNIVGYFYKYPPISGDCNKIF